MKAKELPKIRIAENFWLDEFYVSETHPDVAGNMEVTIKDVAALTRLVTTVLQPLRSLAGVSFVSNSGKRDDKLNRLVGGSKTSQHVLAEAADIDLDGQEAWNVYGLAYSMMKSKIGQCIIYINEAGDPYFIHFSSITIRGSRKKKGDFLVHYSGGYYRYENSRYFHRQNS